MNTFPWQGNAQSQHEAWSSRAAFSYLWLDDCFEIHKFKLLLRSDEVRQHKHGFLLRQRRFPTTGSFPPRRPPAPSNTSHHPPTPWFKTAALSLMDFPSLLLQKKKLYIMLYPKLICMAFSCSYLHLLTGIKASTFLLVKPFPGNLLISSNEYLCKLVQN